MRSELRAVKNDFNHGLESKVFDKAFTSCTKDNKYNFFYINREGPQPRYFKNFGHEFWPESDGRSIAQKKSLSGVRAIRPDTELVPYWVSKGRVTQQAADIYFAEKADRGRPDVSHGAGKRSNPPITVATLSDHSMCFIGASGGASFGGSAASVGGSEEGASNSPQAFGSPLSGAGKRFHPSHQCCNPL